MVAHTFDPSALEAEAGELGEFETSLVFRASSKSARTTQRKKPCLGEGEGRGEGGVAWGRKEGIGSLWIVMMIRDW